MSSVPQVAIEGDVYFYIYIATEHDSENPCKIGYSCNPERRLQALSCGHAYPLILRAMLPCPLGIPKWGSSMPYHELQAQARDIESKIHKLLKPHRIRGEWFSINWKSAHHVADGIR